MLDLNFQKFELREDFQGNQYFDDAAPEELVILEAAGFANGGSRYYELANRSTRFSPENGYLIFTGCWILLLGFGGLVYTLLHRWISKSR